MRKIPWMIADRIRENAMRIQKNFMLDPSGAQRIGGEIPTPICR